MSADPPTRPSPAPHGPVPHGPAPLPAAVRQRLQKVFEHAERCVEKEDYDYANQLYSQCVSEDPANITYLQHFLANLQKKYKDNKKGAKFAALKIKSHRSAMTKAANHGDWLAAFQAGCAALALNPWDTPSLLAMADGCHQLGIDECQLYYLRWALDVNPKDPTVNRQAAMALQRMGQFDQAIACWHRVEQAKPNDEEAAKAISRLSVEKTIHQGGYDPEMLSGEATGDSGEHRVSVARLAKGSNAGRSGDGETDGEAAVASPEERLTAAIEKDSAATENYLQLADLLLREHRFDEADKVLERAAKVATSDDLRVLERQEDVQLHRVHHQVVAAERQAHEHPSDESRHLVSKLHKRANHVELEVYTARSKRQPKNARLQYELGARLKRTGKFKEAIPSLQAARSDPKRKALVLLDLGECFQKIEQYKLALSHYEQAIDAVEDRDSEVGKLALYRAGVLATGLRELDRAERHLTELAGLDFGFRDVSKRLDKLNDLRNSE